MTLSDDVSRESTSMEIPFSADEYEKTVALNDVAKSLRRLGRLNHWSPQLVNDFVDLVARMTNASRRSTAAREEVE